MSREDSCDPNELTPPALVDLPPPYASLERWEKFLANLARLPPRAVGVEMMMAQARLMVAQKEAERHGG
jgi:hypothetical protein